MKNVLKFNIARNGLDLKPGLELKMLMEEIQEFYNAKDLAEQIDAMADVRYVYEGTQLKHNYNMLPMDESLTKIVGQFHRLSTTIVSQVLGDDAQYLDKIMDFAWETICRVNDTKTMRRDDNGKVVKGDIENATDTIREWLIEGGFYDARTEDTTESC